jgi:hypothetical protein
MASQGSAPKPDSSADSSNGPQTEKNRRLTETDIDPSGDVTSDRTGETEDAGTGRHEDNQPAEDRENPTRSDNTGNRDTENAPRPGHEE